jgi:hypothetical protein
MGDLLEAVDALTLPIPVKTITQKRRDNTFVFDAHGNPVMTVVKSELPPLLDQLEDAVTSSSGGPAGKGALASERNVLDADALEHAQLIRDRVQEWCLILDVSPTGTTTHRLRAWHAAALSRNLTEAETGFYVATLRSWKAFIQGKLDPQREKDLPWACPVCGADTWWSMGHEYTRPLVIRYRPEGPDMVERARALCRACEKVWHVRELAYALEHPESVETA